MAEGGIIALIYGITSDGDLRWYRHTGWDDGTNRWATAEGGEYVSGGWNIYRTVFYGGGGVIYGVTPGGDLRWYRHDGWTDGSARWTAGAGGKSIGGGFDRYSTMFGGGDGVIYGITPGGDLQWYRHNGWDDGSNRWTEGAKAGGKNVGGGWNIYSTVFSAGRGVIYGITPGGDLQWYFHDGWADGSNRWTAGGGGRNVGGGWNIYSTVFSGGGGGGVIYGITPGGDLQWYRHDGVKDGSNLWTAGAGGRNVSGGWDIYSTVLSDTAYLTTGDWGPQTIPTVEHVPVGKLDPNALNVITYQRKTFDANGVLRVVEGQMPVGVNQPAHIGPLKFPGESYSYKYSFIDESRRLQIRVGDVTAMAQGRLRVGTAEFEGSIDGKTLTAKGQARVTTVQIEGSAAANVPGVGSGSADGHVVGPEAHASGEVGPDGVGGTVGASAGEIGGHVGVTIGGQPYGIGGEIGLKAEVGLHWGSTSTIRLPIITLSGPNPLAGVTAFATEAVTHFVRDPIRSTEQTVNDIIKFGGDAVEAVGQVVEDIGDLFGGDDDDHIHTDDVPQGNPGNF